MSAVFIMHHVEVRSTVIIKLFHKHTTGNDLQAHQSIIINNGGTGTVRYYCMIVCCWMEIGNLLVVMDHGSWVANYDGSLSVWYGIVD